MTTNRRSFLFSCAAAPLAALAATRSQKPMIVEAYFQTGRETAHVVLGRARKGLVRFQETGRQVQSHLERMAASFAGGDLARQADRACLTIRAIGGSHGLTNSERQRVVRYISRY